MVRFPLDTGEYETIVTSLDRKAFPIDLVKELYHMRWGVEISAMKVKEKPCIERKRSMHGFFVGFCRLNLMGFRG